MLVDRLVASGFLLLRYAVSL